MEKYTELNKIAWEHDAYDFWVRQAGKPAERANLDMENPRAMLKNFSKYFEDVQGLKIANICGSCGKKAVPLAILGASVTVFDISEDNRRYACETAVAANTQLDFIVGDVMDIDLSVYGDYFDEVFMEGGILHYFHDIDKFMGIMNSMLKGSGKMICSDFHPIRKFTDIMGIGNQVTDYFSKEIIEGEMPHAKFYDDEIRSKFPKCYLRLYTIGEIMNAVINSGFVIKSFEEIPSWTNEKLPGEFILLAAKA